MIRRAHWPEYMIEGALLGAFMVAACGLTTILEHPGSPVHRAVDDATVRRILMGLAMGAAAVGLIRSPWGQRSGAHMNPAVTMAYLRLGKIARADAAGYVAGQFVGGALGVLLVRALSGMLAGHPAVRFAVTVPPPDGTAAAFGAEVAISFVLMAVVLASTNSRRLARHAPVLCGALVAAYIAVEAPLSGMSMNPARSFASALGADHWTALWVYFIAPPLGMLAAAETYRRMCGAHEVHCAKLHHTGAHRCIFHCTRRALGAIA